MSAKKLWPCALVLAVLGASLVPAQERTTGQALEPTQQPKYRDKDVGTGRLLDALSPPSSIGSPTPGASAPGELSSWIKYGRPGCCDPVGGNGPIDTELYVRGGPSLPVAGGTINNTLAMGWMITGGGRSLFYDPSMTAAWTVDLSLSHIVNNGNQKDLNFQLNPVPPASGTGAPEPRTGNVRNLHRSFATLGLGREWYLNGAADDFSHYWAFWRFGVNGGARLGTCRMDFNELRDPPENFQRTHDVFWAAYVAVHTDVEIPCGGCCIFHTGFRVEWMYSWLDVFPFDPRSNLHDLSFLWTAGVRF